MTTHNNKRFFLDGLPLQSRFEAWRTWDCPPQVPPEPKKLKATTGTKLRTFQGCQTICIKFQTLKPWVQEVHPHVKLQVFFQSRLSFNHHSKTKEVSFIKPLVDSRSMASTKDSFALPYEAFFCKCGECPQVQPLVPNLHGLVVHIVVFWTKLEEHDPVVEETWTQPSVGLEMENQHTGSFRSIRFTQYQPTASQNVNAALQPVGASCQNLHDTVLGGQWGAWRPLVLLQGGSNILP